MVQVSFVVFIISFCVFAGIMIREPRTLWSGASFFGMMCCLALFLFFLLAQYSQWLLAHEGVIAVLVFFIVAAAACVVVFPLFLMILFFVEGVRNIRHEGAKPSNMLSMLFAVLLYGYVIVWPSVGNLGKDVFGTAVYQAVSFTALYLLALMAMYTLSGILNLIHLRKSRNADYIIVLGAGIIGRQVPPLLAARIERGIEILRSNPHAMLIMSGGQGPGEDIPESEAMAAYAVEKGVERERIIMERESVSTEENLRFSAKLAEKKDAKVVIVTTAYHVFRALILARKQGMKCVGFGAKTKWYFTLNALIREFAGYLSLTWKKHGIVVGIAAAMIMAGRF